MKHTVTCLFERFPTLSFFATAGLLSASLALAQPAAAQAGQHAARMPAVYYVGPDGSDGNPGSEARPWATVQFAVKQAAPGDSIFVEDGRYEGPVIITRSGAPGAYITLKSINPGGAIIEVTNGEGNADGIKAAADYLTIDGFEIYDANPGVGHHGNGITVYQNHHVNILNNTIHDFGGSGIQAAHFDHVLIENNVVYDNAKYNPNQSSGISLYQARAVDDAPGYHVIIRNNRSYGNVNRVPTDEGRTRDGNGILVDDFLNSTGEATNIVFPHRTLIENNLCYDNGGKGIQVFKSRYVDVFNNTAYHNNHDEQNIGTWRAELSVIFSSETVWRNNIGVARPGAGILEWNRAILIGRSEQVVMEHNITYSGVPGDDSILLSDAPVTEAYLRENNLLGVDPQFLDVSGSNFSLSPESPAVDAGSNQIVSFIDIDYLIRPPGAVDIGAFEFVDPDFPVETSVDVEDAPAYRLAPNYPNPFHSQTRIRYTLDVPRHVILDVFDLLGRRIRTLVNEEQGAGTYSVSFDAGDLSNGVYAYRLTAGAFTTTRTMVVAR